MSTIPIPKEIPKVQDYSGTPDVYLRLKEFDSFIDKHGYPCYHDSFLACPCQEKGLNSAHISCKNCHGSGWVLIKRVQSKIMFQQMNRDTEYKDWSIENLGTVSITTVSSLRPKFMDRFVLYTEQSIYSELIYPIYLKDDKIIAFCAYPPTEILDIRMFQGDDKELLQLDISKIVINEEGVLDLSALKDQLYIRNSFVFDKITTLSIMYNYLPSYHVIDIPRNIITSPDQDTVTKAIQRKEFPYHAIGRLSHLVLDRGNLINLPKDYIDNIDEGTTIEEQMKDNTVSKELCETEDNILSEKIEEAKEIERKGGNKTVVDINLL